MSRRTIRYTAAAISAAVAVFYVAYFFVVRARTAGGAENLPVYLAGAALFLIGAVLLAMSDQPVLWAIGAGVPLLAVGLYLWNGVHGVWDDPGWGAAVSAVELVLAGLLVTLWVRRPAALPPTA